MPMMPLSTSETVRSEIARELTPHAFEGLIAELQLKGARFYDALSHPGQGRDARHVMGERDHEGR